jgi:hypothetical protein
MSQVQQHKFQLDESEMPTRWYNVLHDLPTRLRRCCIRGPGSRWGQMIWRPCSPWI